MARPRGKRLNPAAFEDARLKRPGGPVTLTETAAGAGIALSTLSELCRGDVRASETKIRSLANYLQVSPEALFPELTGHFVEVPKANGRAA